MADVRVGDVRRERPRDIDGARVYIHDPFVVRALTVGWCIVEVGDGDRSGVKPLVQVQECPLWPSEHEQWKDARGYEVKT